MKNISTSVVDADGSKLAPPLVVMSLNLRTIMNTRKKTNEIVAASTLVYRDGIY
jgi:hypothetical protein